MKSRAAVISVTPDCRMQRSQVLQASLGVAQITRAVSYDRAGHGWSNHLSPLSDLESRETCLLTIVDAGHNDALEREFPDNLSHFVFDP